MERLTYDFPIGDKHYWEVHGTDNQVCGDVCKDQGDKGCEDCPIRKAIDRLAAYEDTGLSPETIMELKRSWEAVPKAYRINGVPADEEADDETVR